MPWSEEQTGVIALKPDARVLVEAGPGTGKTAVACGRLASLIDNHDILGHELLLVSFTRTAVAELRDRILASANDRDRAAGVRITTIDSHAWSLRAGFESAEEQKLDRALSYGTNLTRALALIRSRDPAMLEGLEELRHVIIDEAQDVLGLRAELLLALIGVLPKACGVTVFADPAQAIYGFTSEDEGGTDGTAGTSFVDGLRQLRPAWSHHKLTQIYRTHEKTLLQLTAAARRLTQAAKPKGPERLAALRDLLVGSPQHSDEFANKLAIDDATLVLFRYRIEALQSAAFVEDQPIRFRMGGMPISIVPWIALALREAKTDKITSSTFQQLWAAAGGSLSTSPTREEAWHLLRRFAGVGRDAIQLRDLRKVLSRDRPPIELCLPELGDRGPIFGTIHASKGREADHVVLAVPPDSKREPSDWDEEARLLYVGATRAKKKLTTTTSGAGYGGKLKSNRPYKTLGWGKAMVFFGAMGDLDEGFQISAETARAAQDVLSNLVGQCCEVVACAEAKRDWLYRLYRKDDLERKVPLAQFFSRVNVDLWDLARQVGKGAKLRPPSQINHLRVLGVRTVCLPDDTTSVQEPYAISRLALAPVLFGFTTLYFQRY